LLEIEGKTKMKRRASILRLARKAFGKDPRNIYVNVPVYPPAEGLGVVRPNVATKAGNFLMPSPGWRMIAI